MHRKTPRHPRRMIGLARAGAMMLCSLIGGVAYAAEKKAQRSGESYVWTQSSFAEFSKGRFGDGGHNTYVSAGGRIQLVNRWDLNNDGWIDLVFPNSHPQAEKLDAAIYWGNGKDFDGSRVSYVPNDGAQRTVAADLNGDGRLDAVVPNYANGTWSKMDSFVYYGGAGTGKSNASTWKNDPFDRKVTLPTEAAQDAAVGDLNKDGFPDIVFALSAGFWEYRGGGALASPSRIFWGSRDGYARDRFTDIEAAGASAVAIGDLNQDGWLDIVLANREKDGKPDTDSFVYFGGDGGFSSQRRVSLPTRQVNAVALADVDGDKWVDIVFANGEGPTSYVYHNRKGAFSAQVRLELPTSDARGVAASDLNGDDRVDVFFANHQTAGNPLTTSYIYWNGPDGLTVSSRQELETVGAWGASIGDLNGDGRKEIVVSNYKEHTSFEVPSYIFWNTEKGFSDSMRTSVFTKGAVGNTIADFNGDGHPDVLFNNTSSRSRGGVGPLYVYWGNSAGMYSVDRRIELPSVEPFDWASGDLNDDGWPELIVANASEIGRRTTESYVYWGSERGYSADRRTALMGKGAKGVGVADLDKDGWIDIFLFNPARGADLPFVLIYWGEPDGFVTSRRTEITGGATGMPMCADLNDDGNLDLILTNEKDSTWIYWGDGTRKYSAERRTEVPDSKLVTSAEVADMNRDGRLDLILTRRGTNVSSYVYYGDGKGDFSATRRNEFKPNETQGVTVADVNADGWLDVIAPRYKDGGSRATMSRIYFGSSGGLSESNILELPTNAGTGSTMSDFNGDGYNDLLLYCHRSEGDPNVPGKFGDHCTDSYLFWGGPQGLNRDRKLLIPGRGTHHDGGADLGNIYDRRFEYDYISSAHEYGKRAGKRIDWKATTPHGSRVKLQVRTASDARELERAIWVGPAGAATYFEKTGSPFVTPADHGWVQYRAILVSPNGAVSPVLESVSLTFE